MYALPLALCKYTTKAKESYPSLPAALPTALLQTASSQPLSFVNNDLTGSLLIGCVVLNPAQHYHDDWSFCEPSQVDPVRADLSPSI